MGAERKETGAKGKFAVHLLVVIFGITSWSIMNGLWVELPILVSHLPEKWTLPSYLTIISQFGNIGPVVFILVAYCAPKTKIETATSFIILIALTLCALFYSCFWRNTAFVAGAEYSLAIHVLTFTQAMFASTTSMAYLAFMAHLKAQYISSLFIGMGLSGLIPALAALGQGPGNVKCVENTTDQIFVQASNSSSFGNSSTIGPSVQERNATRIAVKEEPNFSVDWFFLMLFGIGLFSLFSLLMLVYHPFCKTEHVDTEQEEHCQLMQGQNKNDTVLGNSCQELIIIDKREMSVATVVHSREITEELPSRSKHDLKPSGELSSVTSSCQPGTDKICHNVLRLSPQVSCVGDPAYSDLKHQSLETTMTLEQSHADKKLFLTDSLNKQVICRELAREKSDMTLSDYENKDDTNGAEETFHGKQLSKLSSWYLLLLLVWINILQTSFALAIQVYSSLPYGLMYYHAVTKAENIVDPIASFITIFITAKSVRLVSGLTLLGTLFIAYITIVAAMSPDPILVHELSGGVLMVAAWVMCTLCMVFTKVSIASVMRSQGRTSLLWTGASTQCGSFIGAVLAYLLINIFQVFHDQPWCS